MTQEEITKVKCTLEDKLCFGLAAFRYIAPVFHFGTGVYKGVTGMDLLPGSFGALEAGAVGTYLLYQAGTIVEPPEIPDQYWLYPPWHSGPVDISLDPEMENLKDQLVWNTAKLPIYHAMGYAIGCFIKSRCS